MGRNATERDTNHPGASRAGRTQPAFGASTTDQELHFSVFMEHLPLAVSIKDKAGRFVYANEYMKDLLGADDPVGKSIGELLHAGRAHPAGEYFGGYHRA